MKDMNNYSTKHTHNETKKSTRNAGDIQALVNLRVLAIYHLGQPLFSTPSADTHINPFDPDGDCLHISNSHYHDPTNRHCRGGPIKFVQKVRQCSYEQAISYLEGWQDCQAHTDGVTVEKHPINKPIERPQKPPIQLNLFDLLTNGACR
jgi:hypothetical protein